MKGEAILSKPQAVVHRGDSCDMQYTDRTLFRAIYR